MPYYFSHPLLELKSIPKSLMAKLVAHPDLFVVQTEYSIYGLLKYWVYLQSHHNTDDMSVAHVNNYFSSRTGKFPIEINIV